MESQDIHKIAVIGAGNMGPGISQVFGQAGYSVTINDIDQGTRDGQKSYDQVMQKKAANY